jgi:hypothetical protein
VQLKRFASGDVDRPAHRKYVSCSHAPPLIRLLFTCNQKTDAQAAMRWRMSKGGRAFSSDAPKGAALSVNTASGRSTAEAATFLPSSTVTAHTAVLLITGVGGCNAASREGLSFPLHGGIQS